MTLRHLNPSPCMWALGSCPSSGYCYPSPQHLPFLKAELGWKGWNWLPAHSIYRPGEVILIDCKSSSLCTPVWSPYSYRFCDYSCSVEVHLATNCSQVPSPGWLRAEPAESLVQGLLSALAEHFAETQSTGPCGQRWGDFMLETSSLSYTAPCSPKTWNKAMKRPWQHQCHQDVANLVSRTAFSTSTSAHQHCHYNKALPDIESALSPPHEYWTGWYFRKKDGPECLKLHFPLLQWDPWV